MAHTNKSTYSWIADSDESGNFEIFKATRLGVKKFITKDPRYDSWWPRLSPDNKTIVFMRTPAGQHDGTLTSASLWTINVDGSGLTQRVASPATIGVIGFAHPEWSPKGTEVVIAGYSDSGDHIKVLSTSTWIVTKTPLTVFGGNTYDPSFNPTGTEIVAVVHVADVWVLVTIPNLDAQTATGFMNNGAVQIFDPYISPDGTKVSFIQYDAGQTVSLQRCDINGANKKAIVSDGNINSRGVWRNNTNLWFHRLIVGTDTAFRVWSVNSDGTALTDTKIRGEYPAIVRN